MLGPLVVEVDGSTVAVPGLKQAAILAALAVEGAPVPAEQLVRVVWDRDADDRLEHTLQQHVSGLRKLLEPGRPPRTGSSVLPFQRVGYELVATTDLRLFEDLAARGAQESAAGSAELALDHLDRALALWRGPALSDVRPTDWFDAVAARLAERRVRSVELRADVLLGMGRHHEVVDDLEPFAADLPFREELWGRLMLALYRSGRQADALSAYRQVRTALVDELGLEPGPELRRLEQQVLDQDPTIDAPAPSGGGASADPFQTHRSGTRSEGGTVRLPDGQVVHLSRGRHLVGRQPGAAVPLADSRVSRRHAEIHVDGRGVRVQDLGSTNGTFVDGERVDEEVPLVGGETLSFGGVELVYRAD